MKGFQGALALVALTAAAALPRTATADDPPLVLSETYRGGVSEEAAPPARAAGARRWQTQRNFALLATALWYDGFGIGVRAGAPRVGLDASFAYHPVLATYSLNREKFPEFELLSAFQANASLYIGFHRPKPHSDLGMTFGYKYNSLLGHGAAAAFYWQLEFAEHWALQLQAGPAIFPDAEDAIRRETGWSGGSVASGMAWFQGGLGVSLAYFP